jgi:hypothetical protein
MKDKRLGEVVPDSGAHERVTSPAVPWSERPATPDVVIQRVVQNPNMTYRPSVELVEVKSTRDLEQAYEVRSSSSITPVSQLAAQQVTSMNANAKAE